MTWLALSYFIMAGTIAQDHSIFLPGSIRESNIAMFSTPQNAFEITLGAEFLIAEHFFIGGSVETMEDPKTSIFFSPFQSNYKFGGGMRWAGFELGLRHECDHITLGELQQTNGGYGMVSTEFYVSFKGSMKIF